MNTGEKIKLTITLDEYDAKLLQTAVQTACGISSIPGYGVTSRNRSWIIRWALCAVSSAIIRAGKMSTPLAVELRPESEEETRARMACEIPGQTTAGGAVGFYDFKWN